jgi:hypothetical protein
VDPYQVTVLYVFRHGSSKEAVHLLVRGPGQFVESDFSGVVMKERPQDGICS